MSDTANSQELSSLLERYEAEIKLQVTVDDFNLKQVQMELPVRRHYWVGRLMYHKREIIKLNKLKAQAKTKIANNLMHESPVSLSNKTCATAVQSHSIIIKIDENIAEHELLVDYLTRIESNFRSLSWDIKSLIEIQKLETT